MPKKAGIAMFAAGAVLIASALLLSGYNHYEDVQAGQEAESLLERVEAAVDVQVVRIVPEVKKAQGADKEPAMLAAEMPVVVLDGYEYIGYMEIPALGLKLPVMSDWDYARLKLAPCRQFGSSRTDDLVIAAHNYESHFGRLREVSVGDSVMFTDMDGIVNCYGVKKIETLEPDAVDAVQNSGYDLVLYTCTKGGRTRVTVFCDRVSAPSAEAQEN